MALECAELAEEASATVGKGKRFACEESCAGGFQRSTCLCRAWRTIGRVRDAGIVYRHIEPLEFYEKTPASSQQPEKQVARTPAGADP